ncbi:acetylserotonin O-methyltransferase 2 [Lepisosteus oculatus]|uniref:Acetylserotonin O-methyltransferase n=1 Tax=Lepisosteus oculatus TaxID=7918 RepID=W5MXG1_LEPOC|nr:PREDICTED: acetylserotonin O-methyltransferase-like [Lepisosteus oculatus]
MAEHLSQSELDYPFKLLEYMNGFRISKIIFSACELGVFDLLLQSQKPLSAESVSQELQSSLDGMERLLDALVGIEILDVEITEGKAFYSNTDVANLYLAKGSPKSLFGMAIFNSDPTYLMWANLTSAVREGKNQYEKTFGLSAEDLFETVFRSDEELVKFMGLMNSIWTIDGHDVVTAFDLSPFKTIVDLGGCTGALARELSRAYPDSSVIIFDLPRVVQASKKNFSQPSDTFTFQEGDFFSGEVPVADLYIVSRILHDWKEGKCVQLLQKLYARCQPGGGVLIVEALLSENRRGPVYALHNSLNMLVHTEGKERPAPEYFKMLSTAGFKDLQVRRTGKSYDAVLGRK